MTLEEKTIELQSQFPPLKVEQIIEILKNFKPDEEVVEEVEETPTEEVVSETEVTNDEQTPEAGNQDSSITPDPVVEQTNNTGSEPSDSGDGELPSQELEQEKIKNPWQGLYDYSENISERDAAMDDYRNYKKKYETVSKQGEVYSPENDSFQYKFDISPEGKLEYYYKGPNDDEFVVQKDNYQSAKIAEKLNHLDKKQLQSLSEYENGLEMQRQEIEMISTLPSFDEEMDFLKIGSYDAKAKDILAKVAEIDSALSNFGTKKVTKTEKTLFQYPDPKTGEFKNEKTTVEDQTVINSKQGENYFNKLLELRKKLTKELKNEFAANPLYNKQDEKEAEKLAAEMGYIGRLQNALQSGSVSLGEMIASVPATIYDVAALPQNLIAEYTGADIETSAAKFSEDLGLSNPILDYYIDEGEKLEAINQAYDKANYKVQGVAANFSKGNFIDGFKQMGTGLAESAPVSISMMLGGGYMKAGQFIAGGTLAFAGPEIREMRENNPAMSEFDIITSSLGLASAETVFGFIGKGSIGRTYRTILAKEGKEKGVQVFKKGLIDMYETAIKKYGAIAGTLGEGIEEVATQITQNLIKGIDPFTGVPDAFLLGVGGGGLYTSPVNVAQAVGNVKSGITNRKIDNILTKNNLVSINEAFDGLDVGDGIQGITPVQIDLLKVKGSLQAINARADQQLSAGDITEAQANSIKQKARNVQGANNVLSALDVTTNQTELTALLIEQKNLKNKIKQVDNSSLTKAESERLNEVETQLGELITQDRNLKNIEGAKAFAEGLEGVGLENVKGTEDLISSVEAIEANGGEVIGLAKDKDGNILPAEDQNYGFISRMSDGTTQVILNEVSALKDNVATTAQHEVLHALLDKIFVNNDSAKIEAGKKLEALLNSDGIELDALVTNRLNTASQQLKDGDISEAQYYEEVFTLTSEGLSNDQIVENKNLLDKFTDFGRTLKSIFSGGKLNISFRTGRSALDFVKGYNKAIKSGKGADVAAKTGTIKGTEVTEQGKARPSERIYQKVESFKDKLVNPKTKTEAAFEIANDPAMFNEIDRRLKFDADAIAREDVIRNFLYDESRGMLGLLKGYDPARNDSIMGYLNSSTAGGKLLDARLFEFFKNDPRYERIIQSTTDENIQRKIESKTTSGKKTTTKPKARARTTPKASRKYPSTILSNLGVSTKAEVDALFEEAIADDIANFYKGEIKEFKDIKDIGPAVAALMEKATGLKANRFSKKNQNIMKSDVESGAVTALQQLLNANADADFAMLAEAANIEGKSTSIPGKILEALFTKNSKDKYVRDTRKGLRDYKNIIDALDLEAKEKKGKDAIYRSADAQALKGLANLSLRNLIFEQAVPDPVARTRTGARFSTKKQNTNTKQKSGSQRLDETVIKEVLEDVRTDRSKKRKVLVDVFGSIFPSQVFRSVNFTSGNKVSSLAKRGFDIINIADRIQDPKLRQEAKDLIAEGVILELESIRRDAIKNTPDFSEAEITQIKEALTSKAGKDYKLRLSKLDLHNKGVDLMIDKELEVAKTSEEAFAVLRDFMYHYSLNANMNRNQATNAGTESGAIFTKDGKTRRRDKVTDEHVFQAIEHANAKLQLYRNIINAEKSGDKKKIAAAENSLKRYKEWIKDNYWQIALKNESDVVKGNLIDADGNTWKDSGGTSHPVLMEALNKAIKSGKDADWDAVPSSMLRYFSGYGTVDSNGNWSPSSLNPNNLEVFGKNVAEDFNVEVAPNLRQNINVVQLQGRLINQVILTEAGILTGDDAVTRAKARKLLDFQLETEVSKARQSKKINNLAPNSLKIEGDQDANTVKVVNELNTFDKALAEGRKLEKPVKKIRVFDFDDTLARSNSKVIVIKPMSQIDTDMLDIVARRKFKKEFENLPGYKQNYDSLNEQQKLEVLKETPGATTEINATQFAEQAADLEAQGATFDFSQFEQVIDGKKGPLFDVAKKIADTRGTEDLFILTARPQTAAGPIKAFMKALGIDIPLGNITGLADGTAAAKGRWIAGKAAEGYNDFYFADDAGKNVKAVKEVLDQIDVKSKVQQARASTKQTFDTIVNDMIESSSGIESYKTFSAAKARTVGRDKGRFDWLTLASSAEDFKGLLYRLLGNGKKGEAQYEFLKTNLIDPYNRAEDSIIQAKISAANDFMALKEQFPGLPKTLETETGVGKFTYQHALRTYIWTQQGMSIPGLSKTDVKKLNKFITDDAKLQAFADQLISIQKGKPYPKPGKEWLGGNLTTDIIGGINKVNRKEYQQEWQENVDIIFSPENLNKMEAAYGTRWRKALENSLARMKAGTNRLGYTDSSNAVLDWVNNSVGAVMFLNTRSALLQTISAVNFLNWGDNNIIKAGAAFANQKQYWADFMKLINSDYLVQRRNGLKINVSESEIADAVKDSQNKPKAAIAFLLSKGFVFTRYADSFAIATGGSTFYRNRIKKYLKEGMDQKLAEQKAFEDFKDVAEESQQSSDPSKISMQQASGAGRVILNWANTPMQYVRIQKRDLQDLIAGRGDPKVKIARIAYYGVIQNLIFNAMQQALFAIGFGDDDEDEDPKKKARDDKRIARVANGMIDSQLKGLGIAGMGMLSVKNTLMKIYEESKKKRPEYEAASIEALSFSPAISSKYRKFVGGLKSFSWNMKEMKEKGFSLDNPAYLAGAQIVTAFTNIPIDRVMKKANNIRGILSEQSQMWQKVAMTLGYSSYDIGLPYYGGWDKPVEPTPEELKKQEIDVMKRDTNTAEQTQMLLDLGLDKKQIKALRYEDARVKKIIQLQNKKKDARSKK